MTTIVTAVDLMLEHIARVKAAAAEGDAWVEAWAETIVAHDEAVLQLLLSHTRAEAIYDDTTLAMAAARIAAGLGQRPN